MVRGTHGKQRQGSGSKQSSRQRPTRENAFLVQNDHKRESEKRRTAAYNAATVASITPLPSCEAAMMVEGQLFKEKQR